jgi:hypothetical protein
VGARSRTLAHSQVHKGEKHAQESDNYADHLERPPRGSEAGFNPVSGICNRLRRGVPPADHEASIEPARCDNNGTPAVAFRPDVKPPERIFIDVNVIRLISIKAPPSQSG